MFLKRNYQSTSYSLGTLGKIDWNSTDQKRKRESSKYDFFEYFVPPTWFKLDLSWFVTFQKNWAFYHAPFSLGLLIVLHFRLLGLITGMNTSKWPWSAPRSMLVHQLKKNGLGLLTKKTGGHSETTSFFKKNMFLGDYMSWYLATTSSMASQELLYRFISPLVLWEKSDI